MMPHDAMLDDVAAYALGALPPAEAAAVAEHLRTCERCREEYGFLRPAVTAVGYSAEACADPAMGAVASPLLKARVMKHVRAGAVRRAVPLLWPAYAAAAACLAIALIAGAFDISLNGRLARERAAMALERTAMAQQAETMADFTAPDALRRRFPHGEVLVHGRRLYIAMRDMTMPPRGRVYQAWTVRNGSKRVEPSKTFVPAGRGMTVVRLPEVATRIAAVAISVEPAGGSDQPTTKPIAVVALH